MKERISQMVRVLQVEYAVLWILALGVVLCNELGLFVEGHFAGDGLMEYILQTVGILLVIGLIPFSLRLFSLSLVKRIQQLPLEEAMKSYRRWSEIRLALLAVPVLINLSFYYLTLNTTGLFCAVMALLASLFCVPSRKRLMTELQLPEEGEIDCKNNVGGLSTDK